MMIQSPRVASGGDGARGQLEIFSLNRSTPRTVKSLQLGCRPRCLEYVPEPVPNEDADVGGGGGGGGGGTAPPTATTPGGTPAVGNTICVGLDDGSYADGFIVLTAGACGQKPPRNLRHSPRFLFAGLTDGSVLVYARSDARGDLWDPESHRCVSVGNKPVRTLLVLEDLVWASCGNHVTVIDGSSLSTQRFEVHPDPVVSVAHMVRAGGGVWMAFSEGSSIRLFHTETLEHLQEINISTRSTLLSPDKRLTYLEQHSELWQQRQQQHTALRLVNNAPALSL
ncbi:hypothetical protein CRUP_028998 [Coryphaenoides rupestris]|nr:hypothetical protein CRUP_028998 [Coryphaenoides rupestris]